jgi:Zn-dependent M28 family amino/carboxypeptidase
MTIKNFIRAFLLVIVLFFSSCENEEALNSDNYLYPEIGMWFDYLCSPALGGRYSGSEGIKKAENYICNIIGKSDSLTCITFQTPKCEMTNIIFHIEGESDSLIVIGAHYDAYGYINKTPLPGADDNLSGVAVLLKAIKAIQLDSNSPHYSLDFCFFDGEEIGRYGSKYYVNNCKRGIKHYINIDTCGNPYDGLTLAYSKYEPNLLREFKDMKDSLNMNIDEYDAIGYTTDCEPFETKRIPFVTIRNDIVVPYYVHSYNDNVSNISFSRLYKISESLVLYLKTKK